MRDYDDTLFQKERKRYKFLICEVEFSCQIHVRDISLRDTKYDEQKKFMNGTTCRSVLNSVMSF